MSKNTKKYKVITLSVSGKGNNIYRIGEIVEGYKFNNLDELIKGDYIVEAEAEEEKKEVKKKPVLKKK